MSEQASLMMVIRTRGLLVAGDRGLDWTTQHGEVILISDMKTSHVFYSLKMLWNHFCPVGYRIEPFKRYRITMGRSYIVRSVCAFMDELSSRDDLQEWQMRELHYMCNCMRKLIGDQSSHSGYLGSDLNEG